MRGARKSKGLLVTRLGKPEHTKLAVYCGARERAWLDCFKIGRGARHLRHKARGPELGEKQAAGHMGLTFVHKSVLHLNKCGGRAAAGSSGESAAGAGAGVRAVPLREHPPSRRGVDAPLAPGSCPAGCRCSRPPPAGTPFQAHFESPH